MSWPWYDTTLENRSEEYRERALERMKKFNETYTKASDVVDLVDEMATHEGDPEKTLKILRDGLSIASDSTGTVPLMSDYLTLLSHGADAGIAGLDHVKEGWYKRYRQGRNAGMPHEDAMRGVADTWEEEYRLRYQLEQLKKQAQETEVPERSCDVCPIIRPVDKLYRCGICGNRVCDYCISDCNQDGDDGNYCTECRTECTHDGLQYCEDHLAPCAADGKQYCESYLDVCVVGKDAWCLNHLTDCSDCGDPLCEEHERFCDACAKGFGDPCLTTCEGCGLPYCDDCFAPWIEEWELGA